MYILKVIAATILGAAHSIQRNPINYVSVIDEPVIHTPSHRAHAHSSFDLTFHLHQKQQFIRLTLEPNHDVIAEGATIQYLASDGTVRGTESIDRSEHKIFKGQTWVQKYAGAEWTNVGWARIMLHQDGKKPIFEGAFLAEGDHHHIQTQKHYQQTKHSLDPLVPDNEEEYMVLWRDSDIEGNEYMHTELKREVSGRGSCSSDELQFNVQPDHPLFAQMPQRDTSFLGSLSAKSIFRRQIDGTTNGNSGGVNLASTIGDSSGCFSTRRVALIGVATDCTYTNDLGNTSAASANVITQINLASVQFENSFNITLGLQNLTISDAACPATAAASAPWNIGCSSDVSIQDRLNLFSAWRGARNDSNAYWTLLSTCATDAAVGLAWLGQACLNTASADTNETVSSANVVVRTSTEWQVIAHETGHTFGAVHDCTSETCADNTTVAAQQCCPLSTSTCDANQRFIMNPSTGSGITNFSPCTVGNVCSAIGRNSVNTTCLTANKNVVTISGSQCGNGIVEAGEDCDCGGESGCKDNTCCNPATCKFTTNSVCDPSNEDCCTSSCQLATSGTVCRASTGVCDPQETCSGTSGVCPTNVNSPDGTSCGNSSISLSCASGQCTSRNAQCQSLMGSLAHDSSTYACDSDGCQISCASPAFGANMCYTMQQNFLDGTSCAGGGRCSNGACKGGSVGGQVSEWVKNNKPLTIGLAAGIGGVLLLAILSCCINACRRRSRAKRMPPPLPPGSRRAPRGFQDRGGWDNNHGWSDIPRPPVMRSTHGRTRNDRGDTPPPMYEHRPTERYA